MTRRIRPINWNKIEDSVDLQVWNKLTENFWLPEKIALSNDLKSWNSMSEEQQLATRKVFAGLTALDTIQGVVGAPELLRDSQTPHEEAVLSNISFMEAVHAKSYSSIFSTLCSSEEIEDTFRWAENNEYLLAKEDIIMKHYDGDDPYRKKIVSTLLESFLFYSGFYLPLYWSSRQLLTNTSDIIKLIIRDECYVLGTEILVDVDGVETYKPVEDITISDKVIQFNAVTETTSTTNPVEISRSGVFSTFRVISAGGDVLYEVSPNHKIAYDYDGTIYVTVAKNHYDIPDGSRFIYGNGSVGDEFKVVEIPGFQEVVGIEVPDRFLLTRGPDGSPIVNSNSVHGYYIGYKYQKQTESLPADKRDEYLNFTIDTLMELYDNEVKYTQEIYDPIGLTEDVKKFLKFNANKAMMNLGYDPLFTADQTDASAAVMASLSGSSQQTHDFFSGSGSSYIIAENESTEDEDWDF